jgi:hypothetical protein
MKDHERRRPGRQNQVVEGTDKMLLMFRLAAISRGQNIDNAMPYEYRPKPGQNSTTPPNQSASLTWHASSKRMRAITR